MSGPKIERLTAYRFHRQGVLNEHLFHVWPAAGYDWPVLTTVAVSPVEPSTTWLLVSTSPDELSIIPVPSNTWPV